MTALQAHMAHYRNEHRTLGCKITHMIGIPTIVFSLPMLVWNWPTGIALFVFGWSLQFAGHRLFEKNKPVLMANPKNPLTYLSALIFVAQEWVELVHRLRATHHRSGTAARQSAGPARAR